ncbi:MAG TPA: PEP-CTERM sorting domain-containing protein [Verrucomicrobiae bacterium]|nr:PEP-CTERM sorting domain-containing protein [Verrucomicrobiae bacterium]
MQAANPTLYESAYTGPGGAANFYSVNPDTGAATLIGPIGFNQVGAIDFDASGTLYAVGNRVSDGTQVLLKINPATGAGTEIGPTTLSANVQDISFRNSDGALFGYSVGSIYTFNIATGAATLLGSTGDGFPSGNGLAFSPFDTLYKADNNNLSTIDQSSGVATPVLSLSYPVANSRANGMDFDNATGILWASVNAGSGGSGMNYLATIDVNNGDVTEVGMTQSGSDALVVAIALIPEPGTFALVGMGLVGLLALRRHKKH